MIGILEGLLFVVGDDGLSLQDVMNILEIDEQTAKDLVYQLKTSYENSERGLRLNYLGNTFKLTTKEEHKQYYEKLLESPTTHVLSQAALEVLAIIAYNEPITRGQIDQMRGVDSSYVLRKLLAKGLIKESGKSELPGHPILYKTTNDFLDYFGLSTKEDLPDIETINVDITNLELNGNIRVEDVKADNIEILNSPRIPIASVVMTRQLKQEEATAAKDEKKK